MPSESLPTMSADPGLPTVTPPSGSMFFRLFGVPAMIVGGVVLLLIVGQPLLNKAGKLLFGRAWGSASPQQFLRDLDDSNNEVRWRAANDLAQVLLRDDDLASNCDFALQLTHRLRRAIDRSAPFEKAHADLFAKLSPSEEMSELKKLDSDRNYILLLTQCLGHFMIPAGSPILEELAVQQSGLDPRALNARRRQALWALANLGENLKRFDNLPIERQTAVLAQLEPTDAEVERIKENKSTLDYLKNRRAGERSALGFDRVLETCADAEDPSLRGWAAFAANFWSGTPAENQRIEKTLRRLCDDSGRGEEDLAKLEGENAERDTGSIVKKPGFRVQANAAIALARHGWKVRISLLQTLLDEEDLKTIFVIKSKNGTTEQPDRGVILETMLNALKAVAELHRQNPQFDLSALQPYLDKLAHHPNPAVQTEAGRTVRALSNP